MQKSFFIANNAHPDSQYKNIHFRIAHESWQQLSLKISNEKLMFRESTIISINLLITVNVYNVNRFHIYSKNYARYS